MRAQPPAGLIKTSEAIPNHGSKFRAQEVMKATDFNDLGKASRLRHGVDSSHG